jgi:hypothetical protein
MEAIMKELSTMYKVDEKTLKKAISKAISNFDNLILPQTLKDSERKNQELSWLLAGIFLGKYENTKSA